MLVILILSWIQNMKDVPVISFSTGTSKVVFDRGLVAGTCFTGAATLADFTFLAKTLKWYRENRDKIGALGYYMCDPACLHTYIISIFVTGTAS